MSQLDIATISTRLGYVKIKCSPELTVEELTRLAVQKISLTSSSSMYGLEICENDSTIGGRQFLCPHLIWSEICDTVRNNTLLLSVRFFPTKFEDTVRRDRAALFYLYDQVVQQYKNVWEENRDFQMCFEIGCLMLRMFIDDKITESSLDAVEKSQDLSAFFPPFVLQHQKERYLRRAILNHAPTLQYHSKEECVLEILNRLLLLIQFDSDAYTCFLGAGLGIPVKVLLGPRSQVRISIGNTKEIRLLTFFMSIEKVVVSEIAGREGRRYQVKLILANDPDAGQPIIFTFDSRMVADTVAHTVEGYCRLARPEGKQSDRPLLIWGCPFRPLRNCPLSDSDATDRVSADGESTLVRSQITLERVLGEGQFGDVYKGTYRPAGSNSSVLPVAVKACKVGLSADDKKRCLEEADLHGKLCHPHIIKLYGTCKDEPVWLVLEFAGEGELRHHLIERQDRIPLAILVTYCHQLASALAYIEALRIIHRDVAARNVLVANETCVKLADFGMARELGELDFYVAEPGRKVPIKWMAPESLQSRIFSSASDVWMFGVCMWEILSFGLKPFSNLTNAEAVEHVANGERLARPAICIPILYRLMLECWLKDPVLRPTFSSLQPKLREILSEVKRISLEKSEGASTPSSDSASGRYKEPESAGSQKMAQLGHNRSPGPRCSPSSPSKRVPLQRKSSTKDSEPTDPLYRAVFCVVEALQEIIRKPVVPKPRELVNSVQNVGKLIRSMYVMIQSTVEPIKDITEVDLAERQLNDSFRFLIEDLMTLWKSFADENKFRNELYQRFLSQAYVVAAESRAVYQSVQRCASGH